MPAIPEKKTPTCRDNILNAAPKESEMPRQSNRIKLGQRGNSVNKPVHTHAHTCPHTLALRLVLTLSMGAGRLSGGLSLRERGPGGEFPERRRTEDGRTFTGRRREADTEEQTQEDGEAVWDS